MGVWSNWPMEIGGRTEELRFCICSWEDKRAADRAVLTGSLAVPLLFSRVLLPFV